MDRNRSKPGGGSRNKVRILSPIRETSGIIPVHVVPKGKKIMKGAGGHAPILVQALPEDVKHPKPTMKPSERHYTDVDQVVADYLHYSKYGQVMPVLYGRGSEVGSSGTAGALSCSCCSDRNRENVMKKMALARGEDITQIAGSSDPPTDPAKDTPGKINRTDDEPIGRNVRPVQPVMMPPHARNPWGFYQPTPYAGTFLNPEFNRPFTLQTMDEDDGRKERDQHDFINTKILEANFKYDQSMKKLESHLESGFAPMPNERYVSESE